MVAAREDGSYYVSGLLAEGVPDPMLTLTSRTGAHSSAFTGGIALVVNDASGTAVEIPATLPSATVGNYTFTRQSLIWHQSRTGPTPSWRQHTLPMVRQRRESLLWQSRLRWVTSHHLTILQTRQLISSALPTPSAKQIAQLAPMPCIRPDSRLSMIRLLRR